MKAALVTGSAQRLGRAIVLRLAASGYFTFVHYRNSDREAKSALQRIRENGGDGALLRGDVGDPEAIASMLDTIRRTTKRLDVLVNNIGVYKTGSLLRYRPEDFEQTLHVNLSACFRMIQSALPLFPKTGGSVINIGYAGVESLTGTTHNTAYLISKTGLLVLTKSFAQALGPRHIRVNMVSPGILSNSVELPRRASDWVPLGRLGELEDVADAVEFLVGEKASYVTGVNLDVSGGYHLGLKSLDGSAPQRRPRRRSA